MPRFMPDSNCLVAVISRGHEHHQRATAEMDRRLSRGEGMLLAAHSLVETYSVLTRMPLPQRLSPDTAWRALHQGLVPHGHVSALSAEEYEEMLTQAVAEGITGGAVYDALIAACAVAVCGCHSDFQRTAPPPVRLEPARDRRPVHLN
jgi:predicted nucleic acid-binding protein